MTTNTLDLLAGYDPLPGQKAFHESDAPFRLYSGGFGSGKTKAGCRESIFHAVSFPGSLNMVARLEYRPLTRTTLVTFFNELRETGLIKPRFTNWKKSEMELEWWNGSKTIFSNLDNPENFKGVELDTLYIDEGAEVPDSAYDILIPGRLRGRMGVDRTGRAAGRAWITTNPGASGWIMRTFLQKPEDGWEHFKGDTRENIHNPTGYNDALVKRYRGVWFKRFVEGDWFAFEGQVFPMFDPQKHVLPVRGFTPHPKQHTIYEGWDFGWVNPTCVVAIAVDKRSEYPPVVFADFAESGMEPVDVARAVKEMRKHRYNGCRVESYGDPAGLISFQNNGRDLMGEYAREGLEISPVNTKPQVRAIRLARHLDENMLTASGSLPMILFDPAVERTIQSIRGLRFKPKRETGDDEDPQEKFVKKDDHLFDALSYALWMVDDTDALKSESKRYVPPGVALPAGARDSDFRRVRRGSARDDYEDWIDGGL